MAKQPLTVGAKAPAFALETAEGKIVRLSDFLGKPVVLYFYPKDDTPGCTKEACSFEERLSQLRNANAIVLGISCDPVDAHRRFADKFHLTFPLLSDPDHRICDAYGVYKQKSMYGRTYWGIERTTFLINPRGRIAKIFPKVSVEGHTDDVLQSLRLVGSSGRRTVRTVGH